jgi:REP element-mobilizing transposase RayT
MPHSYVSNLIHCAFSTKDRRKTIDPDWEERVWAFIGGIARKNGFKALAVGGVEDHAHLLLSIPGTMPVAKAVQLVKAGSSKMIRTTFTKDFEWQEGYGAFSIGVSQVKGTVAYIKNQRAHHKRVDFREEFRMFLVKHGITPQDLP